MKTVVLYIVLICTKISEANTLFKVYLFTVYSSPILSVNHFELFFELL